MDAADDHDEVVEMARHVLTLKIHEARASSTSLAISMRNPVRPANIAQFQMYKCYKFHSPWRAICLPGDSTFPSPLAALGKQLAPSAKHRCANPIKGQQPDPAGAEGPVDRRKPFRSRS